MFDLQVAYRGAFTNDVRAMNVSIEQRDSCNGVTLNPHRAGAELKLQTITSN